MIILKKFEKIDIPEFLDWFKDTSAEFLLQFAGPKYDFPINEIQLLETMIHENNLVFKTIDEVTGLMIGHCQLLKIDMQNSNASIGRVLINQNSRGSGFGYFMMKELLHYASNVLELKQLNLRVFDFNRSAIKCYLKLGFMETNRKNVFYPKINKTWNCITMKKILISTEG